MTEKTTPDGEMTCKKCGLVKPVTDMALMEGGRPSHQCKACKNAYGRAWRQRNSDRVAEYTHRKNEQPGFREQKSAYMRDYYQGLGSTANRDRQLRRKYGISLAEYQELELAQGGACAICNEPPAVGILVVDHCHTTGEVRGLLCSVCNLAIGYLKDDPNRMLSAAAYVLANTDVLADLG